MNYLFIKLINPMQFILGLQLVLMVIPLLSRNTSFAHHGTIPNRHFDFS